MTTFDQNFQTVQSELEHELLRADAHIERALGRPRNSTQSESGIRGEIHLPFDTSLNQEFERADAFLEAQGVREPPEPPGMVFGEFAHGVGAGLDQIGTSLLALRATGAQLLDDTDTYNELVPRIREAVRETEEQYPRTVQRVEDVDSVGDAVRFFSRTLGEQIPVIASIFAGGGAGALVGRAIGKGLISRQMGLQLAARLPAYSSGAAAVGTAAGLETGATAEEQLGAVDKINPGVAVAAGLVKGSLEALVPAALGARIGLTPDLSRGVIGKIIDVFNKVMPRRLAAAPAIGLSEGLTESMQEVVDIAAREYVDENYDTLGEEAASRLLNAAVTGALLGTVMGPLFGGGGNIRDRGAQQTDDVPVDGVPTDGVPTGGIDEAGTGGGPLALPAPASGLGAGAASAMEQLPPPPAPAGLLPPPGAAQFRDPSAIELGDRSYVSADVMPLADISGSIYLPDEAFPDYTDPTEPTLDVVATGDHVPSTPFGGAGAAEGAAIEAAPGAMPAPPLPAPTPPESAPTAAPRPALPPEARPAVPHKWHTDSTETVTPLTENEADFARTLHANGKLPLTGEMRKRYNAYTTQQLNDRPSRLRDEATGGARFLPDYDAITSNTVETYTLQTREQLQNYPKLTVVKLKRFQEDTTKFLTAAKKELGLDQPIFVRIVMDKDAHVSYGTSSTLRYVDKTGAIKEFHEMRVGVLPIFS